MGLPILGTIDDFNADLPVAVRQLLQMSGSTYEVERATRSRLNWRYYKNLQYERSFLSSAEDAGGSGSGSGSGGRSDEQAADVQRAKRLWSGVRPLFSICTEAVDTDKRLCFKRSRPLPVVQNDVLEGRLRDKWEREGWAQRIKRSPLYGAVTGDSYLRVVEGYLDGNPSAPSRLEVYTDEIVTVLRDQHSHNRILAAKIEYQYTELQDQAPKLNAMLGGLDAYLSVNSARAVGLAANEQVHWYTLIITEQTYYTFRDHRLYAFGTLGNSWQNRLGIVPIIEVPFNDIGEDRGLCTFEPIVDTCDAVSELASMFGNIVKMHADPIVIFYGVDPESVVPKKLGADAATALYIPMPPSFGPGANPTPPRVEYLEWKGGNAGPLLEFLQMVKADCENVMPEAQLRKSQNRAGSGYELMLDLQMLVAKIEDMREIQYEAAKRALQMALVSDDIRDGDVSASDVPDMLDEARTRYDLKIWSDPVLPRDRATESQVINVNLADRIISRRQGRLDSGMTYIEADQQAEQIESDFQDDLRHARELAEMQAALTVKYGPSAPQVKNFMPSPGGTLTPGSGSGSGSGSTPKTELAPSASNRNGNGNGNGNGNSPLTNRAVTGQPNRRANNPNNPQR